MSASPYKMQNGAAVLRTTDTGIRACDCAYGDRPSKRAPRYIHQCYRGETELLLWAKGEAPKSGGVECMRVKARCKSWRHGGPCRLARAAQDFARIKKAFAPFEAKDLCFMVLTLDRNGTRGGRPYETRGEAYAMLSRGLSNLLGRLNYRLSKMGARRIGNQWVAVVEQHRSGWPHINVVFRSRALALSAAAHTHKERERGRTKRQSTLVSDLGFSLLDSLLGCGFGEQSTIERVRSSEAIAGYFVKLGGELDSKGGIWTDDENAVARVVSETAKMLQVPTAAPAGFRRLRSGVGFLPKVFKGEKWTGVLVDLFGRIIGRRTRGKARSALKGLKIDTLRGRVYLRDDPNIDETRPAPWVLAPTTPAPPMLSIV